jgi:hypothetical protein
MTSGTGTVTNYGSGTGTRYEVIYWITFIKKKFFLYSLQLNLFTFINFSLVKQLELTV